MAGLRKAKQYDWKDSDLALFGSDQERQVKKEAAQSEPAWRKAGKKEGLQVWRIVNFKVTEWPVQDYGKFYNGDSYIILNTYKDAGSGKLLYDVHFWIGKYSTQDEYGTAAYKTVELDTFLDDVPIQHREVQNYESDLFRSYFKTITLLEGGADSGFRKVEPEKYTPRLLHFHGDRHGVKIREVPRNRSKVDSGDVYILDDGLRLIQWNGQGSNKDERFTALQYIRNLASERGGKTEVICLDEGQTGGTDDFDSYLDQEDEAEQNFDASNKSKELYRLSDASGNMTFTLEKSDTVQTTDLDSKDVFILDAKNALFVWIGKETSEAEKMNALTYAHNYLQKSDHPLIPVTCLNEGKRCQAFETAIAA